MNVINNMLDIFIDILRIWGYVSVIVSGFVVLADFEKEKAFGIPIAFFHIPAFLALTMFLSVGFEKALFFIPANWRTQSDGEWYSTRETYARFIALVASFGFIFLLSKYDDMKKKPAQEKEKMEMINQEKKQRRKN